MLTTAYWSDLIAAYIIYDSNPIPISIKNFSTIEFHHPELATDELLKEKIELDWATGGELQYLLNCRKIRKIPTSSKELSQASKLGMDGMVSELLKDPEVDPTEFNSGALRTAAFHGHTETVKLLLEDGRSDPRSDGSGALRVAAHNGFITIVKLLLEDGRVDISADYHGARRAANYHNHDEILDLLIYHENH